MRLHPSTLARLKEMAKELSTKLPDLLIVGAMSMHMHASSPAAYLHGKAEMIADQAELAETPQKGS